MLRIYRARDLFEKYALLYFGSVELESFFAHIHRSFNSNSVKNSNSREFRVKLDKGFDNGTKRGYLNPFNLNASVN